jgi:hypothetical protein
VEVNAISKEYIFTISNALYNNFDFFLTHILDIEMLRGDVIGIYIHIHIVNHFKEEAVYQTRRIVLGTL